MTTWTRGDLQRIAATDNLYIGPFSADGVTDLDLVGGYRRRCAGDPYLCT